MKKRLFCLFLALCLALGLAPSALAEEELAPPPAEESVQLPAEEGEAVPEQNEAEELDAEEVLVPEEDLAEETLPEEAAAPEEEAALPDVPPETDEEEPVEEAPALPAPAEELPAEEVPALIEEEPAEEASEPLEAMDAKNGWEQDEWEYWYYYKNDEIQTGWQKIGGKWYYLGPERFSDGIYEIDGKWYFFDAKGIMGTGWCKDSWGDWYYAGSNGALKTGWQKISGKWYYFDPEYPVMPSDLIWTIKGKDYYFTKSGAMGTGWCKDSWGDWLYAGSDGVLKYGWQKIGGKWYYLDPYMYADGVYQIDGKCYIFDSNGVWRENGVRGWTKVGNTWRYKKNGSYVKGWVKDSESWYYFGSNYNLVTGWKKISGKWYYFYPAMMEGPDSIDGKWYFFEPGSGAMATGRWCKLPFYYQDGSRGVDWYYANADGTLASGWKKLGGKWYYFDPEVCYMYADGTWEINGKSYSFNASGVCTNP